MTAARAERPAVCAVDEYERTEVGRGLCRMHYHRWDRHGSTDKLDGADHEYSEENTIGYPSEGRRRCLACRRRPGP